MKNNLLGVHGQSVDDDSLQADVMRFMAIIAFCLIAILALVRNVEPAPAAGDQEPAVGAKQPATPDQRLAAPPQPVAAPITESPAARPVRSISPVPSVSLRLAKAPPAPPGEKVVRVKPAPQVAAPTAVSSPAPAASPEPPASPERGLSLRFASDRDFIRLVTRGEIQVYAFQQGARVLGLARNFEFNRAPAPGRLYELLPDTIPRTVVSALRRATDDAHAFAWGIRLPPELEGRIRRYVDQDAVGELVIDRFGQVHHVAG